MFEVSAQNFTAASGNPTLTTSTAPVDDYTDADQASFEETASIVSNKDQFEMKCSTFRSWTIGILFTVLISTVNQYFYYQTQSYAFSYYLVFLLAYPIGKFLAWCLPTKAIPIWKWKFSLNPCLFTIKEHALIVFMSLTASGTVDEIDIIVMQQTWFHTKTNFALGLFLALSVQIT
ncbi:unnamed protein product [Didymodactylos carnosus]|uniref:Oligopeptide transporter n=2 Tax=Didymodactylos carnosus TaxID=1234261 RepID=A0A8S2QAZ9_9BILA|nr:unnamed protein product [Didymodactylos carnosus]CAF4090088.1 unnamed protein product [Didymodactylos carnosus]